MKVFSIDNPAEALAALCRERERRGGWKMRDGYVIALDHMSDAYIDNVIAMLERECADREIVLENEEGGAK